MSGDTIIGNKGPIAIKSKLSWLLSGPIGATAVNNLVSSHMIVVDDIDDTIDLQTHDQLLDFSGKLNLLVSTLTTQIKITCSF